MSFATETVLLQLKAGADPEQAGSPTAEAIRASCETVSKQKGFIRQFLGPQLENPQIIVWSIDWEDVQFHKDFIMSEGYKSFTGALLDVYDFEAFPPAIVHTNFVVDPVAARQAPVTEHWYVMVPRDASEDVKSAAEDGALKIAKLALAEGGAHAIGCGWVLEEMDNASAEGGKARCFNLLIGWDSEDSHKRFRETENMQKAIQDFRPKVLPPVPGRSMYHASYQAKSA